MKIFIVGIVASGKTTLPEKLDTPYYEGDCITWSLKCNPRNWENDNTMFDLKYVQKTADCAQQSAVFLQH